MELKPNMYVRFKDKRNIEYIRQITEIPKDNRYASIYLDREANYSKGLSFKNVIKASNNIFDLIEVGDVLLLLDKEYDKEYKSEVIEDNGDVLSVINFENDRIIPLNLSIYKGDIKLLAIVTKEQFDLMKYEV